MRVLGNKEEEEEEEDEPETIHDVSHFEMKRFSLKVGIWGQKEERSK